MKVVDHFPIQAKTVVLALDGELRVSGENCPALIRSDGQKACCIGKTSKVIELFLSRGNSYRPMV
jgi:hypothetical protein